MKIEERPNGGHLLHVYTSKGQLRKLSSVLPHIEKLDSFVDRFAAGQSDAPLHYDLREQAIRLSSIVENLHEAAEMEAWTHVESFAEQARTEREREIEPKREHTQRYFQEQIEEWEDRLETYQQRAEQGVDMSAPIGNAKQILESLRHERSGELFRLEEEKHITPQESDLVTAAFVVSPQSGEF